MPKPKKPPLSEATVPEKQPPAVTEPDPVIGGLSPWTVFQAALKAVPELKYALAVLGIVSAIAIIKGFGVDFRVAVFGTIIMVVLMVALVVFAALTKVTSPQVRWAALLLMWSFLALTILSAALLFTSAFFGYPKPLGQMFGLTEHQPEIRNTDPERKITNAGAGETTRSSTTSAKDRLQIQKEYLPIVEDKAISFNRRCLALAECINAEIFQDQVAFEKTAQLVYQAPKINEVPDSLAEERLAFPPLVQALSPLVPKNLEHLVQHYYDAESSPSFGQPDRSRQAGFWWSVFQDALRTHTDESLVAIATSNLLVRRFQVINKLCANLPMAIAKKMSEQTVPAMRALAAFQTINEEPPANAESLAVIGSLLNAKADDELLLAAQLFRELRRRGVVESGLASKGLEVVVSDGKVVVESLKGHIEKGPRPREDRFHAASEYLTWSAEFEQVGTIVGPKMIEVVRVYELTLRALEANQPEYGNGDLVAHACIEALITLNYASQKRLVPVKDRLPPDAFKTLTLVFGHSEGLLNRVNLQHLGRKWKAALNGKDPNG